MGIADEALRDFLVESNENLDLMEREFVELEANPGETERIASIFRAIHTIKGTAGFFGFQNLERLTHVGENVLSKLREGSLELTPDIASALLEMGDRAREMLRLIEVEGSEPALDNGELIDRIAAFVQAEVDSPPTAPTPASDPSGRSASGKKAVSAKKVPSKAPGRAPADKAGGPSKQKAPPEPRASNAKPGARKTALRGSSNESASAAASPRLADSFVRIDVTILDRLMNLVGELVLARNQILQFGSTIEHPALMAGAQRLNLITSELQEGVMKTRMQPIDNVWNKLPRIVRDLSASCGKQVRVEMEGKDTELDRTVLEAIKDPITHLVRNAVDHGIEDPQVRTQLGKPAAGTLFFRANHEGGQVNIELSDDGRGIDATVVRRKVAKRGLVPPERLARMGDREVTMLIFEPGFSTAEKVTNVSGRGVGMDVVRTNIEKIGGTVDLHTKRGVGTTIKIKIPLTLAIIPALIVTCNGQRYAIPQASLLELVRLPAGQAETAIEHVKDTPVYRQRGRLLPLVYLRAALGQGPAEAHVDADGGLNMVILMADDCPFGLVVDGIHDTEEIVVKPLGNHLKSISAFAGTTIMGDGAVALILDVLGLAERAGVASEHEDVGLIALGHEEADGEDNGVVQTLLLFRVGDDRRMALPLSTAARLEEFPRDRMERAAGQMVVQYRGALLPLIDLRKQFGRPEARGDDGPLQVVVYSDDGHSVGLVVDRIEDIVEETITISHDVDAPGIEAAAVVRGAVTEIVDVTSLLRSAAGAFAVRRAS